MKHIKLVLVLLVSVAALAGCKKSNDPPYVVFRDAAGNTLSSNVRVALNSTRTVYSAVGYERFSGNNLDYDWKIDEGAFRQYSGVDGLDITELGRYNNLYTQKASFTITFSEDIVGSGSRVTIRITDQGSLNGQLTFEVE